MKSPLRRVCANWHYLRRPLREFLPSLILLVVLLLVGGWAFHALQQPDEGAERLTFFRALHATYSLVFSEHELPFPEHWLLQVLYFILPPLGLVVILDGLARFGYHVLRRDETGGEWMRAMAKTYKNHVILVGLGKVGVRVLEQLIRLGEDVVVLERDPQNQHLAFAQKHNVPVLIGNSRQVGILDDLNTAAAKSLIAATDDDLANLEVALDARMINPQIRVVMRMFDQELASKIRASFDIDLAFSTSALAAPLFATSSSDRSILNSFYVGDRLLVVAQLTISSDSQLAGKKIRDVKTDHKIFFLSHKRGAEETHFPHSDWEFQVGDEVVVQTEPATLKLLHCWNGDRPPY
jgi:Trk K+ transport system NAD-binding subunit